MKNHCGTICKGHHWSQEKYKPLNRLTDGVNLEFRNDNNVILVNIHICLIDGKRYKEIELKCGKDLGGGIIELEMESLKYKFLNLVSNCHKIALQKPNISIKIRVFSSLQR